MKGGENMEDMKIKKEQTKKLIENFLSLPTEQQQVVAMQINGAAWLNGLMVSQNEEKTA
jgi:hypothetical protein